MIQFTSAQLFLDLCLCALCENKFNQETIILNLFFINFCIFSQPYNKILF